MPKTTVIKASGARDFLALIPNLMGYRPTESVLMIPFKDSRTLGVMRFDLPPAGSDIPPIAHTMVGMVCKLDDANGVAIVGYSTTQSHTDLVPVLEELTLRAKAVGLIVRDALYVSAEGWGSTIAEDGPFPLEEIATGHPEAPASTAPREGDQAAAAQLPEVPQELAVATLMNVGEMADGEEGLNKVLDLIEAGATDQLDGQALAYLHWCLEKPSVRDILLSGWAHGEQAGLDALEAQITWENSGHYPNTELANIMFGEGPRPEPDRLKQALTNVRILLRILPMPGAFATAAWLAWALGRSSEASVYTERALAIAEEHGLATIVSTFINAGHLPEWAFKPRP